MSTEIQSIQKDLGRPSDLETSSKQGEILTVEKLILLSEKVNHAYNFAEKIHEGQKRHSGEPYTSHLKAVTDIFLGWLEVSEEVYYRDPQKIEDYACACLLHDSKEDQGVEIEQLRQEFGDEVAELVNGVTNLKISDFEDLKQEMKKASENPAIFTIRLADRLHNMRTLHFVPQEEKRVKKAYETLNVYIKIAEEMGMWIVKRELEDLAFKHSQPETFNLIKHIIDNDQRRDENFINNMTAKIENIISARGTESFQVDAVKNSYYEIYRKREDLAAKALGSATSFSHIDDVTSFRISTSNEDVLTPYILAGIIDINPEFQGKVEEGRTDHFINSPTESGYQAHQVTYKLPEGSVQFKYVTEKLEERNNKGVLVDIRQGNKLSTYDRIVVFDPNFQAHVLPVGATHVDLAYLMSIGERAEKVFVDGEEKKLTDKAENATYVEFKITDKPKRAPDPSYLDHCLPRTKKIIEYQIGLKAGDEFVKKGQKMLEPILEPFGLLDLADLPEAEAAVTNDLASLRELYYLIGTGGKKVKDIRKLLTEGGISKSINGERRTTIRIAGRNQSLLDNLFHLISRLGGDTRQINQPDLIRHADDKFMIRLTVVGLTTEGEDNIRNTFSGEGNLDEVTVV